MRLVRSLFIAISCFISCCFAGTLKTADDRIINGDASRTMAVGYLVSVTHFGSHLCTGFLYNKWYVITAASCVEGKDATELGVVLNEYSLINRDPWETGFLVTSVNVHPNFDSNTMFNDIAILGLYTTGIDFIPYAETNESRPGPSCLKYAEVSPTHQTDSASFHGWGVTDGLGGSSALTLRSGKVVISPDSYCQGYYGADGYDKSLMICGSNVESEYTGLLTGPCRYDEGGPIVVADNTSRELAALGIYSKTFSTNCDPRYPSIYTRLSAYYAWIVQVAGPAPYWNCLTGSESKATQS